MNKKEYTKPIIELIESSDSAILAGSVTIPGGNAGDPDTPTPGDGGFIPVESKRQDFRIIDDSEE